MTTDRAAGTPAGYRESGSAERAEVRPVTHVTAEVVVVGALLAALSRELLFRAPHAYLAPLGLSPLLSPLASLVGLALGAGVALRGPSGAARAARSLALAGALAALLPWCFRWTFVLAARSSAGLLLTIALAGACVANASVACARWLARDARDLGVAVDLLSPLRLAQCSLLLAVALAAAANLPLLHAGAVLGACLSITSLSATALARFLSARALPSLSTRLPGGLSLLGAAASALLAEHFLPLAETRAFAGQVVMTAGGARQRVDLVSFGSHFELYVDRALRLSALDHERYPEALVHPARVAAPEAKQVLLLGGGVGLVERELLRASNLIELTVVATDLSLSELVRDAPWPGSEARAALGDPRVTLIESEPAVFVERAARRFDLVVVDADDPIGYREAKHFTRHFYRSVAARLSADGVMVTQLPSPLTFPEAHASVLATLAAAGLDALPYRAALPALGEWGFALAAKRHSSEELRALILEGAPARLPGGLRYVTGRTVEGLFTRPRDLDAPKVPPNTLPAPAIVELYARENARRQ